MKTLKLFAYSFSVFSVIFSFSTVVELRQFTNTFVFILTALFLLLFAVYIEIAKVKELQKLFSKKKASLPLIILTFCLSVLLSGIGIYFWTNTSGKNKRESIEISNKNNLNIETKYSFKIDSINSKECDNKDLDKEISYWKNRRAMNTEERSLIGQNVLDLTNKKLKAIEVFNESKRLKILSLNEQKLIEIKTVNSRSTFKDDENDKNNFLTIVFFIMVLVTEMLILGIQKQISTHITPIQLSSVKMVKEYALRGINMTEPLSINKIKYHPEISSNFDSSEDIALFKHCKDIYNLLFEINLVGEDGKLIKKADQKLIQYFSKINSI